MRSFAELRHELPPMVLKAWDVASEAHIGQKRRGSDRPYIVHPERGTAWLWEHGVREEEMLAAFMLHDAPEDTRYGLAAVKRDFGPAVAALVAELTKAEKGMEPAVKGREYFDQFRHRSLEACLLKMVDRADNMSDPDDNPGRKRSYAIEAMRILLACLDNDRSRRAFTHLEDAWDAAARRLNEAIRKELFPCWS